MPLWAGAVLLVLLGVAWGWAACFLISDDPDVEEPDPEDRLDWRWPQWPR